MMERKQGKLRLRFTAGRFVRREIIRELKEGAFKHDLEVDVDEDNGFFDSVFVVTFRGPKTDLEVFRNRVEGFLAQF